MNVQAGYVLSDRQLQLPTHIGVNRMIYKVFPTIPKAVLDAVEERFPNSCPPIGSSLEDFYRKQGQVEVLEFLKHQFTLQNLNILDKKP